MNCFENKNRFRLSHQTFVAPISISVIRGSGIVRKCPRLQTKQPLFSALLIDFSPSDFEIRRVVGQQGYATITDWEYYTTKDPLAPNRTVEATEPSIRLYEAFIASSESGLYNTRVLLKEFLDDGVQLGVREAEAYNILYNSGGGASSIDPNVVPIATLLGTFLTDKSFEDPRFEFEWRRRFPNSPTPPRVGAPFLVFRWEGLLTGLSCAAPRRDADEIGNKLFDNFFKENLFRRKGLFIRTFMLRTLSALLYLHGTGGIVHRSIGLASILVNTTEYRLASTLLVKIRDLGFACPVSKLTTGKDLERARKAGAVTPNAIAGYHYSEDIYALGYAFLELIFSSLSGKVVTQDRFKKLFEDTFELNVEAFRDYCEQDPEWCSAVEFLDDEKQAGWDVIKDMLSSRKRFGEVSLQELQQSPFFGNVA